MQKRLITAMMMLTILVQLCLPAMAVTSNPFTEETHANKDVSQNIVYDAYADHQATTMTGQGTNTENIDRRTQEQREDDAKESERQKLIDKINEVYRQINEAQGNSNGGTRPGGDGSGGGLEWPDFDPAFPGGNGGTGGFPNITLPDYTQPNYQNPNWQLPDIPAWTLPEFTLPDLPKYEPPEGAVVPGSGDKTLPNTYVVESPSGIFVVDQILVPIGTLSSYAATYKDVNNKGFKLPSDIVPSVTEDDGPRRVLTQEDLDRMYQEWLDNIWSKLPNVSLEIPGFRPMPDDGYVIPPNLDDLLPLPNPGDIIDTTPGQLPDTDIDVTLPNNTDALYELLMRYLRELMNMEQTSVVITRITQYQTREYAIRTIRTATPLAEYRWQVTDTDGGSIETTTDNRHLKMLFRGTGTYLVKVFNTQNVIRNNSVSGRKSEYWLLGNGDSYDGFLIYKNSTSFSAFIGADIGPALEEIELVKDGFNAQVTPEMVNTVQLIDAYGNIMSPSVGHTTERQ